MKLQQRHLAFLGLFLVLSAAMIVPIRPQVTVLPAAQKLHAYIDSLPAGSTIMVSFDYEASAIPEIEPISLVLLRHAFSKDIKVVGVSLLAEGTVIGYRQLERTAHEFGKQYGTDYVYLGFRPQYIAAILGMGESIRNVFPTDYFGTSLDNLALTQNLNNYDNVAAVLSVTDGSTTQHWVEYAGLRYHVKVIAGVTAAMATSYDPYLSSGQMQAMISGLRGAAEYESLTKRPGGGTRGMLAQSISHFYVLVLIAIGNVIYFRGQKRGGK